MKFLVMISSCFLILLFSSGCSQKEPETIYIKQSKFQFEKVPLEGAYISLKGFSDTDKEICVPKLIELNTVYKSIKEAYDMQFDEYEKYYKKFNKEVKK